MLKRSTHVAATELSNHSFQVCVTWCQCLLCPSQWPSANHCACNRKSYHCCTDWVLFTQTQPKHLRQDIWLWEVFSMLFPQSLLSLWVKTQTCETQNSQYRSRKKTYVMSLGCGASVTLIWSNAIVFVYNVHSQSWVTPTVMRRIVSTNELRRQNTL